MYFSTEKVTQRIFRIRTAFEVCAYYVQGEKSGALLDTGLGCGDLKSFIDELATTEYTVILSHGHCDHAGGSSQFEEVYLSPLDDELEKEHCSQAFRIQEIQAAPTPLPETWRSDQVLPQRTSGFKQLTEEMIFDLGGVTIELMLVPGHTKGMMVFLIPEEEVAVFGDACGENTLLCFPEGVSIAEHYKALNKLKQWDGRYTRIIRNHGTFESAIHLLDNNIELCEKVLAASDARLPIEVHGVKAFAAKDRSREMTEKEQTGNIVYTLDKL